MLVEGAVESHLLRLVPVVDGEGYRQEGRCSGYAVALAVEENRGKNHLKDWL